MAASDPAPLDSARARATALHGAAWGRQWPRRSACTIYKTELAPPTPVDADDTDITDNDESGVVDDVPTMLTYDCLDNLQQVWNTFDDSRTVRNVLVILNEYIVLRDVLENALQYGLDGNCFVVTGHAGIGKTMFLIYLLLHRLEHRLPTAVESRPGYYTVFDAHGARVLTMDQIDPALGECWALSDSSQDVIMPCGIFRRYAKYVIQASSPKIGSWKNWMKRRRGHYIVSELPNALEIGAIVKEMGLQTSSTLPSVRKYGPSVRTVTRIMQAGSPEAVESELDKAAATVALAVGTRPSSYLIVAGPLALQSSDASSLIFCRPNRAIDPGRTKTTWSRAVSFIPTEHLNTIFAEKLQHLSLHKRLQLFHTFNPHSTPTDSGWCLEQLMHARVCGAVTLHIFRDQSIHDMPPANELLPGTSIGLRAVKANSSGSFYWMPAAANFPGIDGVLGDGEGNIYTLQATAADEHPGRSPEVGIQKIWNILLPDVRDKYTWNAVAVARTQEAANNLRADFAKQLQGLKLGTKQMSVTVWGCVLPY